MSKIHLFSSSLICDVYLLKYRCVFTMKIKREKTADVGFFFFFSVKFPEVVTLVLTKSARFLGVQRITDLGKFQIRITKDEAQTPLLFLFSGLL